MKKIFAMIAAAMYSVTMFCGCTVREEDGQNYDQILSETAHKETQNAPDYWIEDFKVTSSANQYSVTLDGEETTILYPPEEQQQTLGQNPREITSGKVFDMYVKSREMVVEYVHNSTVIRDKEKVIEVLEEIPVYQEDLIDPENFTVAYYEKSAIHVITEGMQYACEWMFVHELVHCVCDITHGFKEYRFKRTALNEALTDVITATMQPKMLQGEQSAYIYYYNPVYMYLDIVGVEKALKAYFYDEYAEIDDQFGKTEIEFFTLSLENLQIPFAETCIYATLSKWKREQNTAQSN